MQNRLDQIADIVRESAQQSSAESLGRSAGPLFEATLYDCLRKPRSAVMAEIEAHCLVIDACALLRDWLWEHFRVRSLGELTDVDLGRVYVQVLGWESAIG